MRANSNKMFDAIDVLFDSGKDLTVDTKKSHEDRIQALKESVEKKRAAKLLEQQKADKKKALRESYKTKIDSKLRDKSKLKDESRLKDESKLKDRTKLADKDLKEEALEERAYTNNNGGEHLEQIVEMLNTGEVDESTFIQNVLDMWDDDNARIFLEDTGWGEVDEAEKIDKVCPTCKKNPCVCKECDNNKVNMRVKEADLSRSHKSK